jgi:hypothetical protein
MMVISNIKAKLYVLKLRATSTEKTLLLIVNVIQKFQKAVQMCPTIYPGGTQNTALKIGTIPPKSGRLGSLLKGPTVQISKCNERENNKWEIVKVDMK